MSDAILSYCPSAVICRTATKFNGILAGRHNLYCHITSDVMGQHNIIVGITPFNAELNPNCHLLALLGNHHIFYISRVRVSFGATLVIPFSWLNVMGYEALQLVLCPIPLICS